MNSTRTLLIRTPCSLICCWRGYRWVHSAIPESSFENEFFCYWCRREVRVEKNTASGWLASIWRSLGTAHTSRNMLVQLSSSPGNLTGTCLTQSSKLETSWSRPCCLHIMLFRGNGGMAPCPLGNVTRRFFRKSENSVYLRLGMNINRPETDRALQRLTSSWLQWSLPDPSQYANSKRSSNGVKAYGGVMREV